MTAMDAGVLVSYYKTESNGDLFYNKSIEIYNPKDFHFYSDIYSKAFINRDNEIVLSQYAFKGNMALGIILKLSSSTKI